jgi:hypothetical protein
MKNRENGREVVDVWHAPTRPAHRESSQAQSRKAIRVASACCVVISVQSSRCARLFRMMRPTAPACGVCGVDLAHPCFVSQAHDWSQVRTGGTRSNCISITSSCYLLTRNKSCKRLLPSGD